MRVSQLTAPKMTNTYKQYTVNTTAFYGLNRGITVSDGEMNDMLNLTTDYYPQLATCHPREKFLGGFIWQGGSTAEGVRKNIDGYIAKGNDIYFVVNGVLRKRVYERTNVDDSTSPYKWKFKDVAMNGNISKLQLTEGKKQLISMGAYICVLPDKKWYNTMTDECGDMGKKFPTNAASATVKMYPSTMNGTRIDADSTMYTIAAEAPKNPKVSQYWFNTTLGQLYVYDSDKTWTIVEDTFIRIEEVSGFETGDAPMFYADDGNAATTGDEWKVTLNSDSGGATGTTRLITTADVPCWCSISADVSTVNVWPNAATSGTKSGSLRTGDIVKVTQVNGNWCYVSYSDNTKSGWICQVQNDPSKTGTGHKYVLSYIEPVTDDNPDKPSSEVDTPTKETDDLPGVGDIPTQTGISKIDTDKAPGYICTMQTDMNIRNAASTDGEVVGTVKKGDTVTVLQVSGNWAKIINNSYEGESWVCMKTSPTNANPSGRTLVISVAPVYKEDEEPEEPEEPTVDPSQEVDEDEEEEQTATIQSSAYARDKDNVTTSERIGIFKSGTVVTVTKFNDAGTWAYCTGTDANTRQTITGWVCVKGADGKIVVKLNTTNSTVNSQSDDELEEVDVPQYNASATGTSYTADTVIHWNQLYDTSSAFTSSNTMTYAGITISKVSRVNSTDYFIRESGEGKQNTSQFNLGSLSVTSGHKYVFRTRATGMYGATAPNQQLFWLMNTNMFAMDPCDNKGTLVQATETGTIKAILQITSGSSQIYTTNLYVCVYDLTLMFGSGNEPSLELFNKMFTDVSKTDKYTPYDADNGQSLSEYTTYFDSDPDETTEDTPSNDADIEDVDSFMQMIAQAMKEADKLDEELKKQEEETVKYEATKNDTDNSGDADYQDTYGYKAVKELCDNPHPVVYAGKENNKGFIVISGLISRSYKVDYFKAALVIPDMDYACEANNRIWGCRHGVSSVTGEMTNEIFACKQGDFHNWTCYEGVATDSYTVSLGCDGDFTGAISLGGIPYFFKEKRMIRITGSMPSQYGTSETECRGVDAGDSDSLRVIEQSLIYKTRDDVIIYNNGSFSSIGTKLGQTTLNQDSISSTVHGLKYYLMLPDAVYVYDYSRGLWTMESSDNMVGVISNDEDMFFIRQINEYSTSLFKQTTEYDVNEGWKKLQDEYSEWNSTNLPSLDKVDWNATFGAYGYDTKTRKYMSRFDLRMYLPEGSAMKVEIQYDHNGRWEPCGTLKGRSIQSFMLPVRPRRCDHCQVRISGNGPMKLLSLARILEQGSDNL